MKSEFLEWWRASFYGGGESCMQAHYHFDTKIVRERGGFCDKKKW